MRKYSVRPAITLRGRKFKGLRGFAGKPFHPPLTDIPIGAYIIAAAFDVVSVIAALVSSGATYGGSLVFDYGFNVETAGDSPVWHTSETDVFPGDHGDAN